MCYADAVCDDRFKINDLDDLKRRVLWWSSNAPYPRSQPYQHMSRSHTYLFLLLLLAAACSRKPTPFSKLLIIPYQTDTIPAKAKVNTTWIRIHNTPHFPFGKDTIGQIYYDNRGRVLEDHTNPWWSYIWNYDSSGIVTDLRERDWDYFNNYKIVYREVPDSLMVYQEFTDDGYTYSERYRFDKQNRLIERTLIRENDIWNGYILYEIGGNKRIKEDFPEQHLLKKYFYDDRGKASRIELWATGGEFPGKQWTQLFYYTGARLDSTVKIFDHYDYDVVSYYNSNGLEQKRVYADTLVLSFSHVLDTTYLGAEYFR